MSPSPTSPRPPPRSIATRLGACAPGARGNRAATATWTARATCGARDRPAPPVAHRIAALEEVGLRRPAAFPVPFLRPLLAPAGHRPGPADPQVVLHVRLAVARMQPGQHEVAAGDPPPDDVPAERH